MDVVYDEYEDVEWEYIFFYNNEIEDKQVETLHLNKTMFYPTVYHEGVGVVSAQIESTYYENEFFNKSVLIIREEYLGEDANLRDWYREYIYQKK